MDTDIEFTTDGSPIMTQVECDALYAHVFSRRCDICNAKPGDGCTDSNGKKFSDNRIHFERLPEGFHAISWLRLYRIDHANQSNIKNPTGET